MEARITSIDSLQFKALLVSRAYIYEAFHHLCGGVPNSELLDMLASGISQDAFEEYERSAEMVALLNLLRSYEEMGVSDAESFLSDAKDEYTRVFIGPMALPASPYESPYTGSHDMALLQENTLLVRQEYRKRGFQPKRIHAVPDDHVAFMCSFMSKRAIEACRLFDRGEYDALSSELESQGEFLRAHMLNWLSIFSESVATSKAASSNIMYPTVLKALSSFIDIDSVFILEGISWLESGLKEPDGRTREEQASGPQPIDARIENALEEANVAYEKLSGISQVGLEDYSLARI